MIYRFYITCALILFFPHTLFASNCDNQIDLEYWKSIKNSKNIKEFEAYLSACPNGKFAPLAKIRMRALKPVATTKKPTTPKIVHSAAQLIKQTSPAIVTIRFKDNPLPNLPNLPPDHPFMKLLKKHKKETANTVALTGVIISKDGLVVTEALFKPDSEITVTLNDNRKFKAKFIAKGSKLALLKIESKEVFKFLKFSDRTPHTGENLLLIGNTFGLHNHARIVVANNLQFTSLKTNIGAQYHRGEAGAPLMDFSGRIMGLVHGDKSFIAGRVVREIVNQLSQHKSILNKSKIQEEFEKAKSASSPPEIDFQVSRKPSNSIVEKVKRTIVKVTVSKDGKTQLVFGTLVSEDGFIVASNAIAKSNSVQITLHNGTKLSAKVIVSDKRSGMALIKINKNGKYPFATFSNEKMNAGDKVFYLSHVKDGDIDTGIISSLSNEDATGVFETMRLDTQTYGAVFNMEGKLIGIVLSKYTFQNQIIANFAIPSEYAGPLVAKMIKHKSARYPRLGVAIQTFSKKDLGIQGALISSINKNSAAARFGLKKHDIIIGLNNQKITTSKDLVRKLAFLEPGTTATIKTWRDGKIMHLKIKLDSF